ncbi:glycoside hydrolase family 13 protein [Halobacillus sp. B23F22_1]|uniref:glycoside hydrolase family 13 protein n=1 Tax=Halobacillus sp. B23F22_1 TaxID=3459514 RepID=UPI00373F6D60
MKRKWWKEAVAYQIYPRSFMDSNGDGIGDLQGILSKLDYLQDLGVDVIWICPVYPSPNDDNGYDISDFKGIMSEFGTMEDFDELLNEIHKRGMRLIMDLVINHTSDEHPWFIESKSSKDNPYRDFYIWLPGKDGKEPNNWASIFEGSAWASFDGHRNQQGIQTYLEELKDRTFSRYDIMTVGEANGVSVDEANEWVGEKDGKFNMIFQFEHTDLWGKEGKKSLDIHTLKRIFTKWQTALDGSGWNALFLENHDLPRSVSVWGNDEKYHTASSKCLAAFYFLMQGTPFIYQGQEIGMTNVHFPTIDDYDDVAAKNLYQYETASGKSHEKVMEAIWHCGRDNSRTPMQWSAEKNAGFTSGTPWIKVNPNNKQLNVEESMARSGSIYHFYKQLIQLRKDHPALIYGSFQLELPEHDQIFAYSRNFKGETFVVMANLTETHAPTEAFGKDYASELYLSNYEEAALEETVLQPFETRVFQLKGTLI